MWSDILDWQRFLIVIRNGISNGDIKVSQEITDYDIAVQYAVGRIGARKGGYPLVVTPEEIYKEMQKFAPDLLEGTDKE